MLQGSYENWPLNQDGPQPFLGGRDQDDVHLFWFLQCALHLFILLFCVSRRLDTSANRNDFAPLRPNQLIGLRAN